MDNVSKQHFAKPTPVQMAAIPLFFKQSSMVVVAPTGSGKTLAYALPLLSIIKVIIRSYLLLEGIYNYFLRIFINE